MAGGVTYLLASDHAGSNVKAFAYGHLRSLGLEVVDLCSLAPGERVDYPDIAVLLCRRMLDSPGCVGILSCGSGIGVSIAANRFSHIRAALCTDSYMATMARLHNDSNVLCIGEWVSGAGVVRSILDSFINTDFEGHRHALRVDKLSSLR